MLLLQLLEDPASCLTPSGVSAASPTLPCKPKTKKGKLDEPDIEQMSIALLVLINLLFISFKFSLI